LQVVSISAFEAHSGSTSHHPSDNIYLENGKNLRDILSAGQEAADCGDNILRALKHAIGEIQGAMKRKAVCTKCGGPESGKMILCKGARCSSMCHPGMSDQTYRDFNSGHGIKWLNSSISPIYRVLSGLMSISNIDTLLYRVRWSLELSSGGLVLRQL
jgi:hypothetical protein